MEAEALLNHSLLVLSPFEAFSCKAPLQSEGAAPGIKIGPDQLAGKEAGIQAAQGELSRRAVG